VVFASLPKASSALVKEISIALFLMPDMGGGNWGFASDFSAVQDLYRSLKMGPFEYLNRTTPEALFYEYRFVFISIALILLIGLLYIISVNRLVAKRTKDLRQALKNTEKAQKDARSVQERLFQLEKAGVVQELSALFAHEAQQPIASLINYSDGLKQYFSLQKKDEIVDEALSEISSQAQRLSDIINRVRSYAKRKNRVFEIIDLNASVERALLHVKKSQGHLDVPIRFKKAGPAFILADSLEIELVIVNLVKNSLAALAELENGAIDITLKDEESFWKLAVCDNGKELAEDTFQMLTQPVNSSKGLGLGLSICKVIAENHGGKIRFEKVKPQGLAAYLYLPKAAPKGEQN
jgi:two-component system sensor histidine kinase TtrS